MIVIKFFKPPLYFMLQLAAAAPGLFMPLFMLLLKIISFIIPSKLLRKIISVSTFPRKYALTNLLV